MGIGLTGLRAALVGADSMGVNRDRTRRSMPVALRRHSMRLTRSPGRSGKFITFGHRCTSFSLPVVIETTFGCLGMSEHRLMCEAQIQFESEHASRAFWASSYHLARLQRVSFRSCFQARPEG
jgi:hypothetical protein